MKFIKILMIFMVVIGLTGCSLKLPIYGAVADTKTKHIVTYTDADVKIQDGIIKSDDTSIVIISFGDSSNEDVVGAMKQIKEIFEIRSDVYKAWVNTIKTTEEVKIKQIKE